MNKILQRKIFCCYIYFKFLIFSEFLFFEVEDLLLLNFARANKAESQQHKVENKNFDKIKTLLSFLKY